MGRSSRNFRHKQRARQHAGQISLADKAQRAAQRGPIGTRVPTIAPARVTTAPIAQRGIVARRPAQWLARIARGGPAAVFLALASASGMIATWVPHGSPLRTALNLPFAPAVLLGIATIVAAVFVPFDAGSVGRVRELASADGSARIGLQTRLRDASFWRGISAMILTVVPMAVGLAVLAQALGAHDVEWAAPAGVLASLGLAWAIGRARDAGTELILARDRCVVPIGWGRVRTVRYVSIAAVKSGDRALVFGLHTGTRVACDWRAVNAHDRAKWLREITKRCPALDAARPVERLVTDLVPDVASARFALLDRGGRALSQWRDALQDLLTRKAGYREIPVSREDVVRVLGDARAPVERRIAAAVALMAQGEETYKARVRAAIDAEPARPVRVALERVLRNTLNEATLARALADERERKRGL